MMELGKIIYSLLADDAEVSAIAENSIYPGVIPQDIDRPVISYEIGSLPGVEGNAPIFSPTVNVSCFAKEKQDAHDLGQAVHARLEGAQGAVASVALKSIWIASYQEAFDPDMDVWAVLLTYTTVIVLT